MIRRKVNEFDGYTIYTSFINNEQAYITVSVINKDLAPVLTYKEIYNRILEFLAQENLQIIQERIWGSNVLYYEILNTRSELLRRKGIDVQLPFTYVEGNPYWGEGLAGIQMNAVKISGTDEKVWTVFDENIPCGRGWIKNNTTFIMLQNISGLQPDAEYYNREEQTCRMFDKTERILRQYSGSYRNVIRTWIYLDKILDWYKEFNIIRNAKYQEFGFIPKQPGEVETEQIYLPASTGILGTNPEKAAAIMDVLAVIPGPESRIKINQTSGVKQKSPFWYGSAFSRAMNINEPESTTILLSGTASIDEQGRTVYIGDTNLQIQKTIEVINALLKESKESISINDICTATVFLKKSEDFEIYKKTAEECGLTGLPTVCVVADVCRDDLLFELDATIVY